MRSAHVERLRRTQDVRAVFAARRTAASPLAVVHAKARPGGVARATVVAGKKVGNAVVRNRVKRRLRGVLQQHGAPAGADFVIVGRRAAATADAAVLSDDVQRLLRTASRR